MKTLISAACAAAFAISGSVIADEPKPIVLTAAEMDTVVAGVGTGTEIGLGFNGRGSMASPFLAATGLVTIEPVDTREAGICVGRAKIQ